MVEQMLQSYKRTIHTKDIQVVYNLIFKNALYSLECYKVGMDRSEAINYSLVEDITDDEGDAEAFLHLMAKGKVLPVHILDMAQDYFTN